MRRIDRAVKRVAEEKERLLRRERREAARKEKQLRPEKWRAAHPTLKATTKKKDEENLRQKSPAWIAAWLKDQIDNYLRQGVEYFDKDGTHYWAMTAKAIAELCRIIYLAGRHHNDKRGYQPNDNYARREKLSEEGDGHYLDRGVMPEIKNWTK